MTSLLGFALNELLAVVTILIVFPGMIDPDKNDTVETLMLIPMLFLMSFVWWIFLAVCPIAFLIDRPSWKDEWPGRHFRRVTRRRSP